MHELSIMQAAMDLALRRAQEANASRVHLIRLRVGQLSGVVPDALQFAFEALSSGTLAHGAKLDIEHVPARFWCGACQREFVADDMIGECPDCHGLSADVRSGRELELASMEIE